MSLFPQIRNPERVPHGLDHLEHDLPCVPYDFSRLVDKTTPESRRVYLDGNHLFADVFLERPVEEKRHQDRVEIGHIGAEALERQLLGGKVFQLTMDELVGPPTMIETDEPSRLEQLRMIRLVQQVVDLLILPDIGVKDSVGSGEFQESLLILVERLAVDRTTGPPPAPTLVFKLEVAPALGLAFEDAPVVLGMLPRLALDVVVELSATDEADPEIFAGRKDLRVKETTVETKENRHVFTVVLSDELDGLADQLVDVISMVAVALAAPKDGVDDMALPRQVKRLKSFDFLVRRCHAVALLRPIIVHHHGIETKDHNLRSGEPQPPQEQLAKKLAEQVDFRERERFEETLGHMRGKQIFRLRFHDARVPGVFFQGVEVAQVPACAVEQEDEDLLENLDNRKPFATFAQCSKEPIQEWIDSDALEVSYEQAQASSAGQGVGGDFDYLQLVRVVGNSGRLHLDLPPVGLRRLLSPIADNLQRFSSLPRQEGNFCI